MGNEVSFEKEIPEMTDRFEYSLSRLACHFIRSAPDSLGGGFDSKRPQPRFHGAKESRSSRHLDVLCPGDV